MVVAGDAGIGKSRLLAQLEAKAKLDKLKIEVGTPRRDLDYTVQPMGRGSFGGNMLIEGLFARFMYMSLYRLHIAALHGYARMVLDTFAHWLRRTTLPRVKLH